MRETYAAFRRLLRHSIFGKPLTGEENATGMKVLVCGSIGYGGIEQIRALQSFLRGEGFEIVDQLSEKKGGMDYSAVTDFRDEPGLSRKIAENDLRLVKISDVLVRVPNGPSDGTAIEMYEAKKMGKPVVGLCEKEIPSPWPIYLSTDVVRSRKELLDTLKDYQRVLGGKQ